MSLNASRGLLAIAEYLVLCCAGPSGECGNGDLLNRSCVRERQCHIT